MPSSEAGALKKVQKETLQSSLLATEPTPQLMFRICQGHVVRLTMLCKDIFKDHFIIDSIIVENMLRREKESLAVIIITKGFEVLCYII